jgi:hypothetical protein
MDYLFILGSPDIEMSYIEKLARSHGHEVAYAFANGRRVHAGNAYKATSCGVELEGVDNVVWVECGLTDPGYPRERIVDHHREGDPGYDMPPERYWQGSSLGQVCDLIAAKPSCELRLAAAADHCLGAAYQGLCPGVDPRELRAWRNRSRARWKGVDPKALAMQVDEGIEMVRALPTVTVGAHKFIDALDGTVPELSEVSAILGVPVMYGMQDGRSGRIKVGALNGTPEALTAWMEYAEHAMHLQDIYGSPIRGYAGGYLAASSLTRERR